MKSEIPTSTTMAPSAIAIALLALSELDPEVAVELFARIVGAELVVEVTGATGTPGENGLLLPGIAGLVGLAAAVLAAAALVAAAVCVVLVLVAATAVAGTVTGSAAKAASRTRR